MPAAKLPTDEQGRIAALYDLGILDSGPDKEYDIFPLLAKSMLSVPVAAISLIDHERQWFKASFGLNMTETPREFSFCAHAILKPDETLCVPDATKDPRFSENPLVTAENGIRFYMGVPIKGPSGHALGALCVIDHKPRDVDPAVYEQLRQLAIGVETTLRLQSSVMQLRKLALTDALTGLQNRASFDRRMMSVSKTHNSCSQAGLLFLDLDGFKQINDLFGHASGDSALCEVARRLQSIVRADDGVYRFGGDEFCIVVERIETTEEIHGLAARIHAALALPFFIENQPVPLRTSIGATIIQQDEIDPEHIIQRADSALYEAKSSGRGTTRIVRMLTKPRELAIGRTAIEEQLRLALSRDPPPFSLAFQPIFLLRGRRLSGFEALIRWPQPCGRLMPPSEFIPVAESKGLITLLDRWVIDEACQVAAGWPSNLDLSVNISAANFLTEDLTDFIRITLERIGFNPARLKLEITETVLLQDPPEVRHKINALRNMGIRVVLDDFGSGHASLAYLQDYNFDELKIDRVFIKGLESDPKRRAFIRVIVDLARALNIKITVEGIETTAQLRALPRKGIEAMQGYLLGHPLTSEAAESLARGVDS